MNRWEVDLRQHAFDEYPLESCGFLVIIKGRKRYLPCRNTASKPDEHFIMAPEDYARAEDEGEIVAVVHSHPDEQARPSEGDLVQCEASGLPWIIVSVMDGKVADVFEFKPSGYQAPYVGRTFQHGTLDCYGVIRDWYKREAGIELPNIERHDEWWDDGYSNLYMDNLGPAGFEVIGQYPELEIGDMVLMEVRSKNGVPNHAGVYLGDGRLLHHFYGRLSSVDEYMGYWREVTRCVARHKGLKHG